MGWDDKVQNLLGHCTSAAAFGGDITHIPQSGPSQVISGIWSDTYLTADPDDGVTVMSSDPNVGVRLSDLDTYPTKRDQIQRNGINYYIRAIEPDGEGGATLVLEKVDS